MLVRSTNITSSIKSVGNTLWQFRSDVRKRLIDANGNVNLKPPTKYANLIDVADWKTFVTTRTQDNTFLLKKSDAPSNAVDLDDLWVDAHKNKECAIDNEQVQEVANRVVSLKEREDFMQTPDSQVVLDKALGLPEYSGRIRGAKFGGINSCILLLDIPSTQVVGVGKVHNTLNVMLHNARIPPNHVKVTIDIAIEDDILLSIPLDEDIITLEGAIGTYVGKGIDEHSATPTPKAEHASKKAKVVKSKLKENKSRSMSSYKESYLYDNLISKNKKKVMLLSPHSTTLVSRNDKRKNEQAEYVAEVLIKRKDASDLLIAPFNIGQHWVLVVINRISQQLYYLEFLKHCDQNKYPAMKDTFTRALHIYKAHNIRSKSTSNITWTHVKTISQSTNKDCGYCVVNFMKEFIKQ
ncbi:hypothetical protein Lal_00046729 [Lupinus albus]|nr:hypothetical protein Lal_00046729 [Lupinus albus]